MTLDERIAIAAENCGFFKEEVIVVLAEAFPELFSDPPTGWIAPWTMDAEMDNAIPGHWEDNTAISVWQDMRDSWLSRHPMKPTEAKE